MPLCRPRVYTITESLCLWMGINARSEYEEQYSLHQFSGLPHDANKQFHFTNLSAISFHAVA